MYLCSVRAGGMMSMYTKFLFEKDRMRPVGSLATYFYSYEEKLDCTWLYHIEHFLIATMPLLMYEIKPKIWFVHNNRAGNVCKTHSVRPKVHIDY